MSKFGTSDEAHDIASYIIEHLSEVHSQASPMLITAAMAMALGAMAGSMNALGVTKPGRTRHIIDHLTGLAKHVAEKGLEAA